MLQGFLELLVGQCVFRALPQFAHLLSNFLALDTLLHITQHPVRSVVLLVNFEHPYERTLRLLNLPAIQKNRDLLQFPADQFLFQLALQLFQVQGKLVGRAVPVFRIFRQGPQQNLFHFRGIVGQKIAQRGRWLVHDLEHRGCRVFCLKRQMIGKQLVENYSSGENVRAGIDRLRIELLRSHVPESAHNLPGAGHVLIAGVGNAKIEYLNAAILA